MVAAIIHLLGGPNGRGVPVGPSVSALLAEAVLSYVDERLLGAGIRYARFNDDFRFFCSTRGACDEALSTLQKVLKAAGGLSVQGTKTKIQSSSEFLGERENARQIWVDRLGCVLDPFTGYENNISDEQMRHSVIAKEFLRGALDSDEGEEATKDARAAYRAIPPSMRAEVVPEVVGSIFGVWQLSSDVALSLRTRKVTAELDREDVVSRFVEAARGEDLAHYDYCLLWLLDAFWKAEWPTASLDSLREKFPSRSAAYREYLMLLSTPHVDDDGARSSGWVLRGLARATGCVDTRKSAVKDDAGAFESALLERARNRLR